VEKELVKNGYKPGSVDGVYTTETGSALRAYQKANNLEPSGLPDQRTLFELFLRPLNK
jgi:peptidoglycan hydrolase-like protein with peptidoglycan-binding domain